MNLFFCRAAYLPSPLGFRGSGAVAAFSIVGIGFDVHDIPTPQARPEIAISYGKSGKGIDGDPQPRGSLFPAQIAPGWDVGFKGLFRGHGLKGFPRFVDSVSRLADVPLSRVGALRPWALRLRGL